MYLLAVAVPMLTSAAPAARSSQPEGPVRVMATPGDVFAGYKTEFLLSTGANQQVVVGRLNVPAGAFTTVDNSGYARTIRCVLDSQGDWDRSIVTFDGVTPNMPIVLTVNHVFPAPGTVTLSCGFDFQSGRTLLQFIKIDAIAAAGWSNTTLT
ncbi:hypothetical protein [Saccharothrix saharensis]|nr:hypothetical protein [Saccharothrix saharensis]